MIVQNKEEDSAVDKFTTFQPGELQTLILPNEIETTVNQWLSEMEYSDELKKYNVLPRKAMLLFGEPGCGKTTLARNVASRLNKPMLLMNLAGVQGKYKGDSEKAISSLFDEAHKNNGVLFLDEIDAIANDRGSDTAQHNRMDVIALLQGLDRYKGIVIAATNMDSLLDGAVWRRFDIHLEIPLPDPNATQRILRSYLSPFKVSKKSIGCLAALLEGVNASVLKKISDILKRDIVLSPKQGLPTDIYSSFDRVAAAIKLPTGRTAAFWDSNTRNSFIKEMSWPLKAKIIEEVAESAPKEESPFAVAPIAQPSVYPWHTTSVS